MDRFFDVENPESGFRLTALEFYNWGTFDRKVWRLFPKGKSSLLTGGNGSGKTTVVDAIITLLVPPARRYYNQSSGADKKKDRSEVTYVKGAFKTVQGEEELAPKTQFLRTADDFSVLLGVFFNRDMEETLTLAQVRWFANNELKKAYVLSHDELNIQEHFNPIDPEGKWRKRLAGGARRVEFYKSFQQYCHAFSRVFGLRSQKALALFSQTVGIKVLGNLNEFIRANMLEEQNVERDFLKLRANYDNLLFSHKAIEKAKAQVDLLEPVIEGGEQFEKISGEAEKLESAKQGVQPCFAKEKIALLEAAMDESRETLKGVNEHLEIIETELSELGRESEELVAAISTDKVSEQILSIEREIDHLTDRKSARKINAEKYNRAAERLSLPVDPDEALFRQSAAQVNERKRRHEEHLEGLINELSILKVEARELKKEFDDSLEELESLRMRKNNIPMKHLSIRKRIADHLDIRENEIPFVGELVRVKESDLEWEGAIEILLRDLGLSLLIPEKECARLNRFVEETVLKDRVVYHKVPETISFDVFDSIAGSSLISKLEINSDEAYGLFYEWIARHVKKKYDYICVADPKDFERLDKALMPNGMIKDFRRFEKDDRPGIRDKARYIFGWDNKEKIRFFERRAKELSARIKETESSIEANVRKRKKLEGRKEALIELAGFDKFSSLDWKSLAPLIEDQKEKKRKLLESSDKLKALKEQLARVKQKLKEKDEQKVKLAITRDSIQNSIRQYSSERDEKAAFLAGCERDDLSARHALLAPYVERSGEKITLESIARIRGRVSAAIENDLKHALEKKGSVEKKIILRMGAFINGNEEIREKYPDWTSDTKNLMQDVSYLNEYRAIHERIESEDLPRYKRRFKDYLNEQVVLDIADFKTTLENQVMEIKSSIHEINRSLKEIDYNINPATYVKLIEKDEKDIRVRKFRQMLREAMPDAAKLIRGDEQELEHSFNKIKELIERLTSSPEWRFHATDVRNWLKFAAEEKFRADDAQKQYYEDSISLSGGEKAKLAYTILASAIAYQFGIQQRGFNLKSLRFVVVDEAFSKVDPENSVYAMELFKRLNLQLMLVTPLDKINLAEKYIHAVHYVENKHQRESSVYDLTMEQYRKEKESFKQQAASII